MFPRSGITYLPVYEVIQRNAAGKIMENRDSLHKHIGLQVSKYDVHLQSESKLVL